MVYAVVRKGFPLELFLFRFQVPFCFPVRVWLFQKEQCNKKEPRSQGYCWGLVNIQSLTE